MPDKLLHAFIHCVKYLDDPRLVSSSLQLVIIAIAENSGNTRSQVICWVSYLDVLRPVFTSLQLIVIASLFHGISVTLYLANRFGKYPFIVNIDVSQYLTNRIGKYLFIIFPSLRLIVIAIFHSISVILYFVDRFIKLLFIVLASLLLRDIALFNSISVTEFQVVIINYLVRFQVEKDYLVVLCAYYREAI